VALGLDPGLFWGSTPRIAGAIIAGSEQSLQRERFLTDLGSWQGAHLTGTAINNGKNFPRFDQVHRVRRRAVEPQDWRVTKALIMAWGRSAERNMEP
jgi:hypothetical protein